MTGRWRLRDTVEIFDAGHDLFISHGAANAELVIRGAGQLERDALHYLQGRPVTTDALTDSLAQLGHDVDAQDAKDLVARLGELHLIESPELKVSCGLPESSLIRHDRQMAYFADLHGQAGSYARQRVLAASRVLILGCGGLGSWTAVGLAESGVGRLTLVDPDSVEISNLGRQLLFTPDDIGRAKVDVVADRLRAHDASLEIETHRTTVNSESDVRTLASGVSLVVATADTPPHLISRWVDAACWQSKTPWISAGQFPPLVRVGPLVAPGHTSCLECLERSARRTHPHFDRLVSARQQHRVLAATTGPASALVGSLLAHEAVAWLADLHRPATLGAAITIDLTTLERRRHTVPADTGCPRCG
jgi:molybdopterin/thiamine biosynthesis adenylyltransferase